MESRSTDRCPKPRQILAGKGARVSVEQETREPIPRCGTGKLDHEELRSGKDTISDVIRSVNSPGEAPLHDKEDCSKRQHSQGWAKYPFQGGSLIQGAQSID